MSKLTTFQGLVYVKHGRVGTRSEGPDYYLQTRKGDYLLKYEDRYLWKPDYFLEFYCRRMVEITGKLVESEKEEYIKVKSVVVLCTDLIPS